MSETNYILYENAYYSFNHTLFKEKLDEYVRYLSSTYNIGKGVARKRFAFEMKKSEATIKNWCSGKSVPSFDSIELISKLLEIDLFDLIENISGKCISAIPSSTLMGLMKPFVLSFEKTDFQIDLNKTFSIKNRYQSRVSRIYYKLPVNDELLEHHYNLSLCIELFFSALNSERDTGAGSRVFLLAESDTYSSASTLEVYSQGAGDWERLLLQTRELCEQQLDSIEDMVEKEKEPYLKFNTKFTANYDSYNFLFWSLEEFGIK